MATSHAEFRPSNEPIHPVPRNSRVVDAQHRSEHPILEHADVQACHRIGRDKLGPGDQAGFNPTRGTLFTLDVELGDPLSSGYLFAKGETRIDQLVPVGPLLVGISGHGGLGWAAGGRATLALEDRFTLGGSSSLRGFRLDTVGPLNRVVRPDIDYPDGIEPIVDGTALAATPTHWVPTGGDALLALSLELRVPLTSSGAKSTSLMLFSDAGHVSFLDQAIITTSRLEDRERPVWVSVGAGLHLPTPIGPASLDLAVNLDPIEAYDEPWILPHLSLGAL